MEKVMNFFMAFKKRRSAGAMSEYRVKIWFRYRHYLCTGRTVDIPCAYVARL
ncbi:MAG: hypothetical protein K0R86_1988 [Enterobacter kobei]|jgi:hypothetical protein|nr:hypothetical protein [Enterobacter kobei]